MGRGPLLRTLKKKALELTKIETKARLETEIKVKDKHIEEILKQKLLALIDKIDPLELAAILAGTVIVHDVIFKLDDMVTSLDAWKNSEKIQTQVIGGLNVAGIPVGGVSLEILKTFFPEWFEEVYGQKPEETKTSDVLLWGMSFAISYYTFKHGGALLGVAKMFFGGI